MSGNFEIVVDGEQGVAARVKADANRLVSESKDIAEDAAQQAAAVMRFLAPEGEENIHVGYDSLKSRIAWSRARYRPGGAGGGGHFEAKAGVRRSPMHPDPEKDPAVLILEGTGLYGKYKRPIVPRVGNLLVFMWKGRKHFTPYVKGQLPKRLWLLTARERANAVVATRLAMLAARD